MESLKVLVVLLAVFHGESKNLFLIIKRQIQLKPRVRRNVFEHVVLSITYFNLNCFTNITVPVNFCLKALSQDRKMTMSFVLLSRISGDLLREK